ncbi:MAG TPA: 2-amino-4-hydroxy-6-hydroxymethyldihydropteridine diphosphokinase [Flavobacteriales bacterium]
MLLLLGADQGDPRAALERAQALIHERVGSVLAHSRAHWTEAWGFRSDALFLNQALLIDPGGHSPREVLGLVLGIERDLGRFRDPRQRYGPRTIDIDILLAGRAVVEEPGLQIPHPRMHERYFALAPAADLVPGLRHPRIGRTVLELLNDVMQREAHG